LQVDQVLQQKLGGLSEPLELCDASGRVFGHYLTGTSNRQLVADAANSIDQHLGDDRLNGGESRVGNSRVLLELPLVVFFDVNEQDRCAIVWAVNERK
jgi:hypothetical protein